MNDRQTNEQTDDVQQQLVAYLDGELEDVERQQVERRLADDGEFRGRLKHLQETWDMLDHLTRPDIPNSFTRTTIEVVAASTERDNLVATQQIARRRSIGRWGGISACVAAAVIGFFVVSQAASRDERILIENLEMVNNIDYYKQIPDVEFLVLLDELDVFGDELVEDEELEEDDE